MCESLQTDAESAPWIKKEDQAGSYSESRGNSLVEGEVVSITQSAHAASSASPDSASLSSSSSSTASPPPYPYWMSLNLPSGWIRLTYQVGYEIVCSVGVGVGAVQCSV
jgi:hypothetical protein